MLSAIGIVVGLLIVLTGVIWFLAVSFHLNAELGIWCLLLGTFFQLILFFKNPRATWKPLLVETVGCLVFFFSFGIAIESIEPAASQPQTDREQLYEAIKQEHEQEQRELMEELRREAKKNRSKQPE